MISTFTRIFLSLVVALSCLASAKAQQVDESYRLRVGDAVSVTVFNEPDLTVASTIDAKGLITIPLLRSVQIEGLSVREAEELIETQFKAEEYLISPQVTVNITAYAMKQVHIFGEVKNPGPKSFPANVTKMDIMEVISLAGDFTDLAKTKEVRVTRTKADGSTQVIVMDVSRLRTGQKQRNSDKSYEIIPGDVIFVPERMF